MSAYSEAVKAQVVRQMMNFQPEIQIPFYTEEAIIELHRELERENMWLFQLGKDMKYVYSPKRKIAILSPQYLYSPQEYAMLTAQVRGVVQRIRSHAGRLSNELERELLIHDQFCKNVTYVDDGFESKTIIGPLIRGRGICEGIAKAAKLLLQECGIAADVLAGIPHNGCGDYDGHDWNVVRINEKWYHLDITVDCMFSKDHIRYDYFNLSTKQILKDRTVKSHETFPLHLCEDERDYYAVFHRYFTAVTDLQKYLMRCLERRESYIQVRLSEGISKAVAQSLFHQCLQSLCLPCQYQTNINEVRNVYEWSIQYK